VSEGLEPPPFSPAGRVFFSALGRNGRRALPGEHGFRFFPRFYKHVVDTMARIPFGSGTVLQNLVDTTEVQMARFDGPPFLLPAHFPQGPADLKTILFALIGVISGNIGVSLEDTAYFAQKVWQIVTSCEERRLVEYERVNWWDFVDAENRSPNYQRFFAGAITRSLVAAKARRASTKTIGDIFTQIVFDILRPGVSADRLLNGPTNDVWIEPWLRYLRQRGVIYHFDSEVRSIEYARGAVQQATVLVRGKMVQASGDYFIAAVPVERMVELLSPSLLEGDPSLVNLRELVEYVEWMNGIQFYLTEDVPIAHGHSIFVDSPWALTSVSQPQFWRDYDVSRYGDGTVKGILSVDISDWDVKGLNGKTAKSCARDEIAAEVWQQMKQSLNVGGKRVLHDDQLHAFFLDPDIMDTDRDVPGFETNAEPLLVNYVDTWRLRPEAVTRIPNLFLASDYVRTYTDLATMEAANEAARRAVNGILRAARSDEAPCAIWNLHEPEFLAPFRAYDRVRFRRGMPWDSRAMIVADAAASVLAPLESAHPLAPPKDAIAPSAAAASHEQAKTAAAARSSSDLGLRRVRILPGGS
jgi:uncharacterized protein with NAD-binding domain and iron-sulfur cluster